MGRDTSALTSAMLSAAIGCRGRTRTALLMRHETNGIEIDRVRSTIEIRKGGSFAASVGIGEPRNHTVPGADTTPNEGRKYGLR